MADERCVLVIDDDESIRQFVSLALADEGYVVETAPHGEVGLAVAAKRHPALILLDLRMPAMDGWTFIEEYRRRPGPHAPIIALTAGRGPVDGAVELGAAAFLAKPFNLDDLLDLVARFAPPPPRSTA